MLKVNQIITQVKGQLASFRIYDLATECLNKATSQEKFILTSDIAYGEHPRQKFDIYHSQVPRSDRALIVFVHGGTWSNGKKEDYLFVASSFAQDGFDVAIINYRLVPEVVFPSYVDDLVYALNYLDQHQKQLNISTKNTILMGHSAGGFNVMSALYHPKAYNLKCNIKAIVGLAGAYHFEYHGDKKLERAFDLTKSAKEVMPSYFVKKNNIHHILLLAAQDLLVATSNTFVMNQKLIEKGNNSQVYRIPYTGHASLLGSLAVPFSRFFKTKDTILVALTEILTPH